MKPLAVLLLIAGSVLYAHAAHKCVWVRGAVRCNKNPAKQVNVEVRVYDKDGVSIFQMIDPDDLMGVSFTDEDGTFQLDGCGDDFDWFPGISNPPEPYVQIRHYCNSDKGETIQLPEFHTFVPDSHDLGVIELDEVQSSTTRGSTVAVPPNRAGDNRSPKFRSQDVQQDAPETQRNKEKYHLTDPDPSARFALLHPDEVVLDD